MHTYAPMLGCIAYFLFISWSAFGQDKNLIWQGDAKPDEELVLFTKSLTDEYAERGSDFQFRIFANSDQPIGVSSTKGISDFHLFFDPKYGLRVISPEQGQLVQRAVLFPGADYSDIYPISFDLEDPASVISFDRRPHLQVPFKIIEVKNNTGLFGDFEYLRLLVTDQGQLIPLSLENISLHAMANLEAANGQESLAYLSNALNHFIHFRESDWNQSHEQIVTLDGPAHVQFKVGRMQIELISSRDFDPKDPWKSFEEKTKLKKENLIQRYPNTTGDLSRFAVKLREAPQVLVSDDYMFLDVVETLTKDQKFFNGPWRSKLNALKAATLIDVGQHILPALQFVWNLESSQQLMASLPKLEYAYLLDLDHIPDGKNGSILDDLDQLKMLDARGYYLTVIANGIARIYYQPTHVDFSMEQLLSTESILNCDIILAGRARMAQRYPEGAN